jgi:hypothetical protein
MALPSYTVYLSFGSSGFIDVTSYVTSVSISRGSNRVYDDVQPGSISVNFNNFDNTFNPFNTSSILYYSAGGYTVVQPNAKVRIFAGANIIFTGWVQSWSYANDEKGLYPTASLSASDGLAVLGNASFDPSLVTAANTATFAQYRIAAATAAWGGTTVALSYYSGRTPLIGDTFSPDTTVLSYLQNVARTEPFNFFGTKDGDAKITARTLTTGVYTLGTPVFNYHKTAGWYNGTATDMSNWFYGGTAPGWGGSVVTNSQFPGEYLIATSADNGGGVDLVDYFEKDETKYKRDQPYSLSFWTNSTDGVAYLYLKYVYVNGASTVTKATGSTAYTFPNGGWNKVTINNVSSTAAGNNGKINALEFYNYSNSAFSQIKDLMITPASAVPSYYFDGERYQQGSDYLNSSAIVATGWTGDERNSTSVYLTKTATGGTATLPAYEVFGDAYGTAVVGTAIPIADLQVAYTIDQFYNQVSVVRASGGTAYKNNIASQALYNIRSYAQSDSLSISPARSTAFASEVIGQYGIPDYVLTSLDVQMETLSTAYQNRVTALELFDIIRVIYRPYGASANIDKTYQIISINHDIGLESHVVSFGLATLNSGLFLDSTYLGVLDTQKVV